MQAVSASLTSDTTRLAAAAVGMIAMFENAANAWYPLPAESSWELA